jgi:hypothetical protein
MAGYLILGAGKFGRLALERLVRQDEAATIWVVDHNPAALAGAGNGREPRIKLIAQDAVDFLSRGLAAGPWDWLIPAVPLHVAFAYAAASPLVSRTWEAAPVPAVVGAAALVSWRGSQGEFYLSRATHQCPDDCRSGVACPVTGESREPPLYTELATLEVPGWAIKVVPSRQLAPGVGGYAPRQIVALVEDLAGCRTGVLMATACRCHGVVHGLRRRGER